MIRDPRVMQASGSSSSQLISGEKLDMIGNRILTDEAKYLGETLKENTTLVELTLSNNGIAIKGAKHLCEALKKNTTLTHLTLLHNAIVDKGAKYLAQVLKENKTLAQLTLSYTQIGADGAKYLGEALKQNTTLTQLTLSNNNIGADGAKYLGEALKQNTTLTQLTLSNNNIGADGAKYLGEALKQNTTLTQLTLSNNNIGAEGAKNLAEALKQNTILTELILSDVNEQLLTLLLQRNHNFAKLKQVQKTFLGKLKQGATTDFPRVAKIYVRLLKDISNSLSSNPQNTVYCIKLDSLSQISEKLVGLAAIDTFMEISHIAFNQMLQRNQIDDLAHQDHNLTKKAKNLEQFVSTFETDAFDEMDANSSAALENDFAKLNIDEIAQSVETSPSKNKEVMTEQGRLNVSEKNDDPMDLNQNTENFQNPEIEIEPQLMPSLHQLSTELTKTCTISNLEHPPFKGVVWKSRNLLLTTASFSINLQPESVVKIDDSTDSFVLKSIKTIDKLAVLTFDRDLVDQSINLEKALQFWTANASDSLREYYSVYMYAPPTVTYVGATISTPDNDGVSTICMPVNSDKLNTELVGCAAFVDGFFFGIAFEADNNFSFPGTDFTLRVLRCQLPSDVVGDDVDPSSSRSMEMENVSSSTTSTSIQTPPNPARQGEGTAEPSVPSIPGGFNQPSDTPLTKVATQQQPLDPQQHHCLLIGVSYEKGRTCQNVVHPSVPNVEEYLDEVSQKMQGRSSLHRPFADGARLFCPTDTQIDAAVEDFKTKNGRIFTFIYRGHGSEGTDGLNMYACNSKTEISANTVFPSNPSMHVIFWDACRNTVPSALQTFMTLLLNMQSSNHANTNTIILHGSQRNKPVLGSFSIIKALTKVLEKCTRPCSYQSIVEETACQFNIEVDQMQQQIKNSKRRLTAQVGGDARFKQAASISAKITVLQPQLEDLQDHLASFFPKEDDRKSLQDYVTYKDLSLAHYVGTWSGNYAI